MNDQIHKYLEKTLSTAVHSAPKLEVYTPLHWEQITLIERRKFSLGLFFLKIPSSKVKIFQHFVLADMFMLKGGRARQATQWGQGFLQQLK